MHWGIRIVACVTAVAALGLVGISSAMNFRFGYSFGRTELDGWLYGGASALSDVLKAAIPFAVVCALKRRRWGQAASGAMVWAICVVFSFSSATGFGIANRSFASDATTLQAGLNRNELAALQSDQQELTHIRATLGSANLRATDRRDLELRETALSRETGELRSRLALAPTILTPTTQAEALAQLFGAEPSRVTNGLVILLASLLELGSGLGMFVALGTFANPPSGKIHSKRTLGLLSSPLRGGRRRMAKLRAGNVVPLPVTREGGRGLHVDKTCDYHSIDLAWMRRRGCLSPGYSGSLTWSRGGNQTGSMRYRVEQNGLRLLYRTRKRDAEWQEIDELVPFVFSRSNFEGSRAWFECLSCRRQCRILYGGSYFRCRRCHDLKYETQYDSIYSRGTSRIFKIRERLGDKGGIDDPFPDKPKGMHWKTYERLASEAERLQGSWAAGMIQHLGLLTKDE